MSGKPIDPLQALFISEFKLFSDSCKLLDVKQMDEASVRQWITDLLEKLKSLEAGALLSKAGVEDFLFEDLKSVLSAFDPSFPEAFLSGWSKLMPRLEKEQLRLSSMFLGFPPTLSETAAAPLPVLPHSEEKTMVDFFLIELETRLEALNRGVLQLEQHALPDSGIEELMRAAHAIKGGARLIGLDSIVQLTHAMEDGFVALEKGEMELQESQIEAYLHAIDLLSQASLLPSNQIQEWAREQKDAVARIVGELKTPNALAVANQEMSPTSNSDPFRKRTDGGGDRFLRVTARSLNQLIGLAGECLIQSRWLTPFGESLANLKRKHDLLLSNLDSLKDSLQVLKIDEKSQYYMQEVTRHADDLRNVLMDRLAEFETFGSRFSTLAKRLYQEVIGSRMRPFADGIGAFPRFVRDMAKRLGKQVHLIVRGTETQVDREILEKLESPLSHLLRNAVDHGIETPQERLTKGKDPEGTIIIEAQHRAGALFIIVSDDGKGCDLEQLRHAIIRKGLIKEEVSLHLSEKEILNFLFLPGFSTAQEVTELSGRGVGLSVVQTMVQEVGGDVHVTSQTGRGMTFSLQLPLTLSVVRSLLVTIGGEIYAVPVSRIHQLLFLESEHIGRIEQKLYFNLQGENTGLVFSHEILGLQVPETLIPPLAVIVIYDQSRRYGIIVEQIVGEQELVVHELDPILGKVANVSAGAFMEDGAPLLILDVEDMMHSIEKLHQHGIMPAFKVAEESLGRKHVLIVDDSATVREVESRLLQKAGYLVETAVDGIDAWNALRIMDFDLVITDLDMPRMNGLELVKKLKTDPRFQSLPVMIISYKEQESEKRKGFEAGADAYLTKGNFHDDVLLQEVETLLKKSASNMTLRGEL